MKIAAFRYMFHSRFYDNMIIMIIITLKFQPNDKYLFAILFLVEMVN